MYNNVLLSLALNIIPMLAIGFVCTVVLYKVYKKIRSKFNANVNCWFCNENTKVPYLEANSWTCPHCEQYNGFSKDGGYNREIKQQLDCSNVSSFSRSAEYSDITSPSPDNGFCQQCNEAQRLKVEKLAQFEPKKETKFDAELKVYSARLDEQYRLCETCERHLKRVLRDKKKMVLGSKFLDFIIKGAEKLKEPHFDRIHYAQKQVWKSRCVVLITVLSLINICCLFGSLPAVRMDSFTYYLGSNVGRFAFVATSHIVALGRVVGAYMDDLAQHEFAVKSALFFRTIFMMILYSMGLRCNQMNAFSFKSQYLMASPFTVLGLAIGHNILDGIKLTRFTLLTVLWSFFASSIVDGQEAVSLNVLMFASSLITLILSTTTKEDLSPKLRDSNLRSFHKIYSSDYLSDEDTMSLLSEKLDGSVTSLNRSYHAPSPRSPTMLSAYHRMCRPPLTSSRLSLHQMPKQMSPNSSFRTCLPSDEVASSASVRSLGSGPWHRTSGLFKSNPIATCHPQNPIFNESFHSSASMANSSFREPHYDELNSTFTPMTNESFVTPMSNGALDQSRSRNSIITPSNFGRNSAAPSWLSGGYFNQRPMMQSAIHNTSMTAPVLANGFPFDQRSGIGLLPVSLDKDLSPTSSESSGFESNGKESSVCREPVSDLLLTQNEHDVVGGGGRRAFQPIVSNGYNRAFSPRMAPAFSVAPSSSYSFDMRRRWINGVRPGSAFGDHGKDPFNLRRINDELPTIQRGDLLKNWQQSQANLAAAATPKQS